MATTKGDAQMRRLTAISAAIAMAFGVSTLALAGDDNFALTFQNGNGNTATVDQTGADNANRLLQFGGPQGGVLPGFLLNHDTVHQVGDHNTASVTQGGNGSDDITAQVNQQGNFNSATINSTGTGVSHGGAPGPGTWAYITTVGNNSTATISQVSSGNSAAAYISQGFKTNTSNNNVGTISQIGTSGEFNHNNFTALPGGGGGFIWNDTNIAQDGTGNQATILQQGSSNSSADVIQIGNGNTGSISQFNVSNNSLASIEQYGASNFASSIASGDADSSIVQNGSFNTATTSQVFTVGSPNVAAIFQTGNLNVAGVTQQGGGNRVTIRQ